MRNLCLGDSHPSVGWMSISFRAECSSRPWSTLKVCDETKRISSFGASELHTHLRLDCCLGFLGFQSHHGMDSDANLYFTGIFQKLIKSPDHPMR